jgi:alpha/beta superfamily hydrolase
MGHHYVGINLISWFILAGSDHFFHGKYGETIWKWMRLNDDLPDINGYDM